MKQLFKNILWQIKLAINKKRWKTVFINLDRETKDFLLQRSCSTGESVEQIIHDTLKKKLEVTKVYEKEKNK